MEQVLSRPPDSWVRLNDIARETRRYGQTLRTFASRELPEAEWCRVRRTQGGGPEVWVSPVGAALVREAYPPLESGGEWGGLQARGGTTEHHGGSAGGPLAATLRITESLRGQEVGAEHLGDTDDHHGGTTEEHRGITTEDHGASPGGWREALEEAKLRADDIAAERDRLIEERKLFVEEIQSLRQSNHEFQERVGEALRRADVAEVQTPAPVEPRVRPPGIL